VLDKLAEVAGHHESARLLEHIADMDEEQVDKELERKGINPDPLLNLVRRRLEQLERTTILHLQAFDAFEQVRVMTNKEVGDALQAEGVTVPSVPDLQLLQLEANAGESQMSKASSNALLEEILSMTEEEVDQELEAAGIYAAPIVDSISEKRRRVPSKS